MVKIKKKNSVAGLIGLVLAWSLVVLIILAGIAMALWPMWLILVVWTGLNG